jgi:hypothetical protein
MNFLDFAAAIKAKLERYNARRKAYYLRKIQSTDFAQLDFEAIETIYFAIEKSEVQNENKKENELPF